jgi:hypothetical protein
MIRPIRALFALALVAPLTLAESLPPPEKPNSSREGEAPAEPPQGPALTPPQNKAPIPPQNGAPIPPQNGAAAPAQAPQNAAAPAQKNPGKPPEFFAERRKQQIARKEAAKQRMRDFQAARAAAEQKLYQDWHERYLADTPVRVEYYRALARAYEADTAYALTFAPYYYGAGPPIIYPAIPIYAPYYAPTYYYPAIYTPVYGTFFYWGW